MGISAGGDDRELREFRLGFGDLGESSEGGPYSALDVIRKQGKLLDSLFFFLTVVFKLILPALPFFHFCYTYKYWFQVCSIVMRYLCNLTKFSF